MHALALMVALTALAAAAVLYWPRAAAVATGSLQIDRVQGAGWNASGIAIDLDLSTQPVTARLRANSVQVAALGTHAARTLRDVSLECAEIEIQQHRVACNRASLRGAFPGIGRQHLSGSLRFDRRTGALAVALADLKVGKGVASIVADWRSDGWSGQLRLQQGDLAALQAVLKEWSAVLPLTISGAVDVEAQLQGRAAELQRVAWRMRARQVTAGTVAGEQLGFESQGTLERIARGRAASGWRFAAALDSNSGQAYFEPVFANLAEHPLTVSLQGDWLAASKTLTLQKFSVVQQAALAAAGSGVIALGTPATITRLHLDIQRAELPAAYGLYLQPFLLSTALASLTTQGRLSGSVDIIANAPASLSLELQAVSAKDVQQRLSVTDLSGALRWRKDRTQAPEISQLRWQAAQLLGIDVGAAAVQFAAADRDFTLSRAIQIPVLDGSIELAQLRVAAAGRPDMMLQLDATLQPISVRRLCAVFGWPPFGGRIGGRLADLQLRDGVVTLGTVLTADVFDGRVRVADLRLEELFGKWPRLSASIGIDRVDLQQVTSAFSFGLITGRLSGSIDGLRLFNWSPVAFDAALYTSANDRSPHRISQRAVKSIGSLGGASSGAAAALSSGFLKFFENFSYERLGIRCRLENEICAMSGVEPAGNGYYLVKGRGVPRIDVIGNAARVDWPRLVKQLQAATELQSGN